MLEADAYCVDVMKQISAVQSALERIARVVLHHHLETCFSQAVMDGRGHQAVEELVTALKFSSALTGPDACLNRAPAEKDAARDPEKDVETATTWGIDIVFGATLACAPDSQSVRRVDV